MSYFRQRHRENAILPPFDPNLELVKLFQDDILFQPKKFALLKNITKEAFYELAKFKHDGLNKSSYRNVLQLLTETEDACTQIKLEYIVLKDKKIERTKNTLHDYKLYMNVIDEFPQEAGEGDYVELRTMSDARYNEGYTHRLSINRVCEKYLEIRTPISCRKILDDKVLYEVKFRKDRTVFRFEQQALRNVEDRVISKVLFPTACGEAADPSIPYEWLSNTVKTNPEQQQAVRNIVNGSSFPAPYILFGPPGTGKTTTLVEAIAQVWKIKPESHILVCASSNYACNEILTRLMDLECVPEHEMFRFLAKSQIRKLDSIEDRILDISNIDKQHDFVDPKLDKLKEYRIVFLTLVTAGRLNLKGMGSNHFDYIFVDEAGSATEASTLIPIAGMVSFGGFKLRNHIVLAGDPKQLGPIVINRSAEKLMYGRSLLDRLMEQDLYAMNEKTKQYNAACLTKLLQNFRSHKNILDIPNRLFYDNQLIPKARPDVTNLALGKHFLPNKKIPIVLHAVFGETVKEKDNPSLFNFDECRVVLQYVRHVLKMKDGNGTVDPREIGIISPYARQCLELRKMLKRELKHIGQDIEVGTVEQFQGQERKVIILSTVRSFTETIGFLNNPKRLNVSITRAKALLIIVGNPVTLQLDKNWYALIEYCKEYKVCTGKKFELKKTVRGRFRDKSQKNAIKVVNTETKLENGVDESLKEKRFRYRPKITSNAVKIPPVDSVLTDDSASATTENESTNEDEASTSDMVSDNESFPDLLGSESPSLDSPENIVTDDDDTDDDQEVKFFPVIEDTFTSEDELTDDDEQNNDKLCDNNATLDSKTVTEEQPNIDIYDFDLNFKSFGFK